MHFIAHLEHDLIDIFFTHEFRGIQKLHRKAILIVIRIGGLFLLSLAACYLTNCSVVSTVPNQCASGRSLPALGECA